MIIRFPFRNSTSCRPIWAIIYKLLSLMIIRMTFQFESLICNPNVAAQVKQWNEARTHFESSGSVTTENTVLTFKTVFQNEDLMTF